MGILSRRHIELTSIIHLGKESNNLDESDAMGIEEDDYVEYRPNYDILILQMKEILETRPAEVKHFGILERTWQKIKNSLKQGKTPKLKSKTLRKVTKWLQSATADAA
jgi:hypothetical protein